MAFDAKKAWELVQAGTTGPSAGNTGRFDTRRAWRLVEESEIADFTSRYNAWAAQANALVQSSNERYFDETGAFKSAWRSDAKDWYASNENAFREVESQRQALLSGLNVMTGLPDDQRQTMKKALSSSLSGIAALAKQEAGFDSEYDYQAYILGTTSGDDAGVVATRRTAAAAIEARIAELDKLIAAEPTPDINYQGNVGDLFLYLGHAAAGSNKTESQKAYEAERDELVTALNMYDRSGTQRSDQMYTEIASIPDFAQKSTYTGESVDAYQQRLDEINALYDDYSTGKITQDDLLAWGRKHGLADESTLGAVMMNPAQAKALYVNATSDTIGNAVAIYDQLRQQSTEGTEQSLTGFSPQLRNIVATGQDKKWEYLTDTERRWHAYLLNENRNEEAAAFLADMESTLARRAEEDQQQKTHDAIVNSHPVMGFIGGALTSAVTVPMVTVGGVASLVGTAADALSGKEYDPYARHNAMLNYGTSQRAAVSGAIEDSTDWTIGNTNVAAFLYNTGMSMADSAFGMATLGSGSAMAMGSRSAMEEAKRLYNLGAREEQIFFGAAAAGVAEYMFERISVGNLLDKLMNGDVKTLRSLTLNILSQAGTEASEEVLTEASNIITNTLIMAGQSDLSRAVEDYKAAGYSEEDAQKRAILEAISQVIQAGVGGFLSGGVMGGGASAVNYANYQALAKEAGHYTASAGQTSETYRLAQALAKKERDKSLSKLVQKTVANPTPRSIGRVRLEVEEALSAGRITAQEAMQILAATRQQNTAAETGSGEVKYSIKQTRTMALTDQIAQVESNELNGSNSLHIGLSKTMTAAGFSDNPFVMNQSDYRKSRRQTGNNKNYSAHGVAREFFEQLDTHLNNSAMVIDNGQKATVITDYAMADAKGNPSYVIAGVLRNQQMYSDTVNQIKSVYPLDDIADKIQKAAEEGRLVITDKNKAEQMLSSIGIQTSQHNSILGLAKSSISQLADDVNTTKKGQHIANTALPQDAGYNGGDVLSTTSISDPAQVVKSLGQKFGVDAETVELMAEEYDGKTDPVAYAQAFATAYTFARYNLPMDGDSAQVVRQTLSDTSIRHATQLGRLAARVAAADAQKAVEARRAKLAKGGVDTSGIDRANLTARQRQSIAALDALGKALGVRFVMYDSQTPGKVSVTIDLAGERRYMLKNTPVFTEDKYFARQMDRWSELKDGAYVNVGTIHEGSALQMVGLPAGKLSVDVSTVKSHMRKHSDHLTPEILKQIPDLLANPIALTEYTDETGKNSVNVYGNLIINGKPVCVGVVATVGRGGTSISKIRTVHMQRDISTRITDNTILYLNENKKETNKWFQALGQPVPTGGTKYGFIRSISDSAQNVKENLSEYADKRETDKWFQTLGQPVPTGGTKYGFIRSISDSAQNVKENLSEYADKKRTDTWLSLNRLQLPVGENQYGSIRSISDSAENVNKKFQRNDLANSNGFYTIGTNEIYVDVRAGLDARGTILFTASHELTHFIEDWSPAKYREFADFLMKELGKTNADVTAWVAHQKALLRRAGTKLTGQELDDAAFSEVVAQACESFLAQPTVLESIERLAKQNQSLYTKIRSWLKQLQTKLYKALGHYDWSMLESAEGRAVAKMTDTVAELVELWSAGLVDAAANAQAASVRAAETGTVTATEGTVKYQLQEYSQHQVENWRNSSRIVLYESDAQVDAFVTEAVENPNFTKKMYFGIVSTDLAAVIRSETGLELEGRNVTLRADNIRKILLNDHGNSQAEKAKKQRAVERGDFAKIPEIISEFDSVVRSENDYKGKPAIKFSKVIQDCKYTVIAVDSGGSLDLFIQTMYVGKKRGSIANVTNAEALIKTPETSVGIAPTKIISNSAENVKEKERGNFFYSFSAEKIKETSTQQTLHAAVSDDVVTNGDFSINSISNTAGNVKVKYSERDAIDKSFRQGDNDNRLYTEEQYNAFGWASYNGVLSAKERETLLSRFADFKHNRHQYPVTRWGEAVIHSTQTPDVIVYVRSMSKIRMPEITRIVRILAADIDDVTEIRKEIILYEQKRVLQSYEALEAIYGEGIFRTSKKRNFASFQEYRSREEGRDGKAVISNLGKQQDGSRGDIPSTQSRGNDGRVKLSDRDTAGRQLTAEQQAFFAESKVRDENGNLIVLYHGTENGGFTVFDAKRSDDGISFFFTDDIRVASSYSGSAGRVALPAARPPKLRWTEGNTKRGKHRAGVYEVYVNLKDPLVVECGNSPWMQIPFRDSETVDISHKVEGDEVVVTIAARSQPTRTVRFAHDGTLRAEAQKYLTERFNEHIGKEYAEMLAEDVDDGPSHLMGFGWNFVENVEQWYTTRDIAEIARQEGYDGVIFHGVYDNGHAVVEGMEATEAEDGGNVYVAFDQTAIKDVDNQTPTADKDIRYQRKGESTREILTRLLEAPYAYDTLVAKPDMKIVRLGETVPQSRKEVVAQAKKNAAAVGKANADGSVSVYVEDIGRDVILSAAGLRHGLDRRTEVNGPVTLQAGAILKNSIRINELRPERKNADGSYVLIGAASSASGQIYIVRSVVNIFSHEMVSMDVLYAISAKKEESAAPEAPRVSRPVTDSTISISEKSGNVNPDGQKEWNRSGDYPQDPPSNNGFLSDSINSISEKSGNVNPNAKKEEPAALNAPRVLSPVTDSTISISDLLEYVNRYFPDVLSEDVLRHFGRTERPAGELGQSALFQTKSPSPRNTLAAALETTAVDEQERQLIRDYLEQADELDAAERELIQVNERIRRMMFSAGERDDAFYEKLGELRKRAGRLKNQIEWGDMRLLSLRSTTPIADLRDRELADAVRRAKQAERAAYREQRESAQRTVLRDRISRRVRHISSMLLRGSKQRNVKPELTGLTVRTLESAAALFEENGENVGECLDALEHAYRDIGNLDPQQFPAAERARVQQSKELYDPEVAGLLADVRERVQDRPVSQLDMATLEAVNRAFTALHHTLTESNKVFRNGKAVDVDKSAGQVINELKGLNTSRKETELGALEWLEKQTWANENPVFAFDRIGSEELSGMFWDFIAGQDTYARDMQDAHDLGAHLRRKYGFNQWDEKTRTSFKLASGQTFSLNLQEMMSIYAYSLREQALAHMTEGGFVFSGEAFSQDKRTGKWMRHNTAVTYRLTEADIGRITAALTKEQKGYVQEMQAYLSQTMGAKGNEVSRVLYGIDLFTERHYFPLRSDRQFLASTLGTNGRQPSMVSLKNTGMTKEIVPGAGNPIVLQGFDEVWGQHVDKMSQYHGMVLPIENLQKVFNYNTYAADGQAISIRNSLNATHGEGAVTYLQQMLSDLNGGINQPGVKSPVLKAFAKFKKNAVGASLSTIVQQPTAIVRAMALIDPKYFAQKAEKQKAPLKTSGDKIAAGMTDAERYEILKRKKLTVSPYNDERYQQILRDHPEVDGTTLSKADAVRTFKKIATEFSVYGTYNNPDIELEFEYGSNRMGESIAKNSSNYNQFAKLLSCFSEVVENAVGIEVHNRNTEGYKPDRTLKNVYVLASAFEDGDQIVPVKLEVKEFADKPNKLYLAVALEGIKKDRVISTGVLQSESHVRTSPVSDRVLDLGVLQSESHVQTSPVTISILDLLQNVNSKDVSLLKYVPGYKKSTETQAAGIKIDSKTASRGFGAMDSISDSAAKVKTYEEIKRYAPIAIIKEMGGFDTGTSAGATAWLTAREYDTLGQKAGAVFTDEYYRDELWMKGAQKADELGWSMIWNAVKAEVADKRGRPASVVKKIRDTADRINGLERPKPNEGYAQRNGISTNSISDSDGNVKFEQQKNADDGYLEIGSEAFYQACGKRFTEVIVRSQVYDSTLSRSGFMRSPSEFNKLATSFMGEGTMSINMMISTVRRALRTHSKADILKAVRTAGCVYAGAILANFAKTFVYAAIDWEDDESLLEKWMQEFAGSWPDLLPTAMLPYVRDVQSMIMGYDLERQEMSVIADMLSGIKTLFSTDYSDPEEVWKAAEDGLGYIAGGGGWPLRNLLRSTRAMVNMVTAAMDTVVPTDMGGALLSGLSFRERAKSERLYTALRQGNQQQIEALRKDYDSDAAFRSATVSALRQYDGRIRQAAARAVQGDFDALSHTADEIYCEQEFDEDIINSALQAEYNALQKALRKAAGYKAAGDTSKYADVVEDIRDDYAGILTQDEVRHLAAAAEPAETTGTDASSVSGGSIYTMTMVNAALKSGDSGQAVNMIDELYRLKQTKYCEAGASRREAEKAARSDVRASLNSYWKKRYIAACNSKDRAEQIRIRELLEATGMYTAAGRYQGLSALLLAWRREAGEER